MDDRLATRHAVNHDVQEGADDRSEQADQRERERRERELRGGCFHGFAQPIGAATRPT
jgi:hypothetical protein